jgi:hypothetical protein
MPVHDWTQVEPGIFHAFHVAWITEIQKVLNEGLLPEGFYALAEQHAGRSIADVLTLHTSPPAAEPAPWPPVAGGTAVADAPPRVRRHEVLEPAAVARRRTVAIRHVSGHRLVAMIEIVSPANKDRSRTVEEFVTKAVEALDGGVHLLVVDLLPPGHWDPGGMHGAVRQRLEPSDEPYDLPGDAPLTLAGYVAGPRIDAYLEHLAVGGELPAMPLFLSPERYVSVPLGPTYMAAYEGMPRFWREVLEGKG